MSVCYIKPSILGNQTWYCKTDGQFENDKPDRIECVEEWIDNITEKVNSLSVAFIIISIYEKREQLRFSFLYITITLL